MTTETVYGDAGFFYIPDLGVKLPLFERSKNVAGQTIVDRENSAEIFRHFGAVIVIISRTMHLRDLMPLKNAR